MIATARLALLRCPGGAGRAYAPASTAARRPHDAPAAGAAATAASPTSRRSSARCRPTRPRRPRTQARRVGRRRRCRRRRRRPSGSRLRRRGGPLLPDAQPRHQRHRRLRRRLVLRRRRHHQERRRSAVDRLQGAGDRGGAAGRGRSLLSRRHLPDHPQPVGPRGRGGVPDHDRPAGESADHGRHLPRRRSGGRTPSTCTCRTSRAGPSINPQLLGIDGLRAPGVEINWLVPNLPFYLVLSGSAFSVEPAERRPAAADLRRRRALRLHLRRRRRAPSSRSSEATSLYAGLNYAHGKTSQTRLGQHRACRRPCRTAYTIYDNYYDNLYGADLYLKWKPPNQAADLRLGRLADRVLHAPDPEPAWSAASAAAARGRRATRRWWCRPTAAGSSACAAS